MERGMRMEQYKSRLMDLQTDMVKVTQCISKMIMSNSESANVLSRQMDDFLCELENVCIRSRTIIEKYRPFCEPRSFNEVNENIQNICGSVEVTDKGWLHITLNTLLPNCRHRVSNYIGDTVSRLLNSYGYELPYFEKAFMAIIEYCNYENHNALDNDNKGWKMIPNALKGRVIEDDTQFNLNIGLFTKVSENLRCEIFLTTPEDAAEFMEYMYSDII